MLERESLVLREWMVVEARVSMLDPMVADQRVTQRSGFVHESHIPRVCSLNRGSRSTSASSSTNVRTVGNGV